MPTVDVAVIGGGPAGAAASITLARAGRSVVLVDRACFPRDKCCGDGLTAAALRHLERLGLRPEAVDSWRSVDEVWLRSPSGRALAYPLPRQGLFAAMARRADLDAALLDVAREAGVEVRDGCALLGAGVVPGGEAVRLEVDGMGVLDARYAVGADGMWSPLRKALGVADGHGYLGEWHAFRQYFTGVDGSAAERMWVWFEPDLLPGYAWSFPLPGGRANVGFGVQRRAGVATRVMKAQWEDLLRRPHVAQALGGAGAEATHKAWPIPARVGRCALSSSQGRALFVGDAARAADPMTGEGIGQALETGTLAAQAILAAGPADPVAAATRYEAAVGRGLGVDNRLAAVLSRLLSHDKGARAAIRLTGLTGWTRESFARWLFEGYPRGLLATPHRWRRGVLAAPGAYAGTEGA